MPDENQQHPPAIEVQNLGIKYRRYREKIVTLKDAMLRLFSPPRFEEFWALREISLTVPRGQSLGIIGPNGSGKSTLLKAIAGILPPSTGTLRTIGRIAPMIELGAGFNDELTGRENIYLNGAIMGLTRQEMAERIERIIEYAGIGDSIDVAMRNYSSGMRTRLGFAVTSDVDPDILLLDEVFSVGDEEFRAKSTKRMKEFFRSKRTVVTVTHSLDLVTKLCHRVILLRNGAIVADGEPVQVVDEYRAACQFAADRAAGQTQTA